MAKNDKNTEEKAEAKVAPVDPRLALWREHVENYKKENPVKAAAKQAHGEFDAPPASFQGIKKELPLANGGVRVLIY